LKQASAEALNLYNKGMGGNAYYQGERHADLSETTQNALKGLENAANQYNNSVFNEWFKEPTKSAQNLSEMAAGSWMGNNSKFNDALSRALNKTSDLVN
ncbi:MAG: tail fiber domain-containing protein, partial [Bartonella sp.]|nr:tail fiber domain-containing protein [Bartonella sp.]